MNGQETAANAHPHNPQSADYYQRLGANKKDSIDQIKSVYRKIVHLYHPDKNPGNEKAADNFRRITEAYEVLTDEKKRAKYDALNAPPEQRPQNQNQRQQQGQGIDLNNLFNGFGDFFQSIFGGAPQQQRTEVRSPELIKLQELQNGLMQAQTLDGLLNVLDNWFKTAGTIRVDAIYPFRDFPLNIGAVHEILRQFKKNESRDTIIDFFDTVVERNHSKLAAHISKVLSSSVGNQSQQTRTSSQRSESQTNNNRSSGRPETSAQPTTEQEKNAVENLLSNLTDAQTLEETIKALKSWTSTYSRFKDTHTSAFYSFSPAELLTELEAFTSSRFTRLDQSTHLKGFSPVAVGISRQVTAYLERRRAGGDRPVETASGGAKPAEATEPPKPVDADHSGSVEINKLREALLKATTLEDARKLLQGGSLLAELITNKPMMMPSVLATTLNAVVNGTITFDQAKFFKETIAAGTSASPVAQKLLELAQAGQLK